MADKVAPDALKPGDDVAGKYTIEATIGVGGMGVVYRALHRRIEQQVAIKMLLPSMLRHPEIVARGCCSRTWRSSMPTTSDHVDPSFVESVCRHPPVQKLRRPVSAARSSTNGGGNKLPITSNWSGWTESTRTIPFTSAGRRRASVRTSYRQIGDG